MSDYFELRPEVRLWVEGLDHQVPVSEILTWDPKLVRAPRVKVPVDVQALVVTDTTQEKRGDLKVGGADPTSTAAEPMETDPFSIVDPLAPGVHLHWALPDALTAASPDEDSDSLDLGLPPLPDRWLVCRIGSRSGVDGRRPVTGWIIESDVAVVTPLWKWDSESEESNRPGTPLTAVSGGDVTWAAVYDNVINRFAFHDPLEDVSTVEGNRGFTYVVMGWYADPTEDPIHPSRSPDGLAVRLDELGWIVDLKADEAASAAESSVGRMAKVLADKELLAGLKLLNPASPSSTLFHGAVLSVKVSASAIKSTERRPSAQKVDIALGPTGAEAVARLISEQRTGRRLDRERLLTAFAHGVVDTFARGTGVGVEEGVHRASFRGLPGGSMVELVRRRQGEVDQPDRPIDPRVRFGTGLDRPLGSRVDGRIQPPFEVPIDPGDDFGISRITDPGVVKRRRPLPRFHVSRDLAIGLRNLNRSLRHGYDGVFEPDEVVRCRLSGEAVTGFDSLLDGFEAVQTITHGGVPSEINELLAEAVMLDPLGIDDLAARVSTDNPLLIGSAQPINEAKLRLQAEQQLSILHAANSPGAPELLADSRRNGSEPSQLGITYWRQPWIPLVVEWEATYRLEDWRSSWQLGDVDYERSAPLPDPDRKLTGRSLLTAGGAKLLADQLQRHIEAVYRSGQSNRVTHELSQIASTLQLGDLMGSGLSDFSRHLQGFRQSVVASEPDDDHDDVAPVEPPELLRAGSFAVTRLRVVDTFGRVLDLTSRLGRIGLSEELSPNPVKDHEVPSPIPASRSAELAPRLTVPARLMFRFADSARRGKDARIDESRLKRPNPTAPLVASTPIVGWLLPDHADDGVEFFDADGHPLGQLFHRGAGRDVVWEPTPGLEGGSAAGPRPNVPGGPTMANLARSILAVDARQRDAASTAPDADLPESPLAAMLRVVDTTTWTTDPYGSTGLEHVSEVLGRPIAVVNATVSLQLHHDLDDYPEASAFTPEVKEARKKAFETFRQNQRFPVRLGTLNRFDDGLLGYFVDGDLSRLFPVHTRVRSGTMQLGPHTGFLGPLTASQADSNASRPLDRQPVTSNYVANQQDLMLQPDGETINLTLLMLPGLGVTATSGLLPRKTLEMPRAWTNDPLRRLMPSFRFGPLLVDPKQVSMPKTSAIQGPQRWTRRDTPSTWRSDPIAAALSEAKLPTRPFAIHEGWITAGEADEEESP